jgi:hypothetical protein
VESGKSHGKMRVGNWESHPGKVKAPGPWSERFAEHHGERRHLTQQRPPVIQRFGGAAHAAGVKILMVLGRLTKAIEPGNETINCEPQLVCGALNSHMGEFQGGKRPKPKRKMEPLKSCACGTPAVAESVPF